MQHATGAAGRTWKEDIAQALVTPPREDIYDSLSHTPRCPPARWPIRQTTKPILTTSSSASCHRCQTWIIDVFVEHVNAHDPSQRFRLDRGDSCAKSTSGSAFSSPASSGPWPTIRTRGNYGHCGKSAGLTPRGRSNTSASCSCSGILRRLWRDWKIQATTARKCLAQGSYVTPRLRKRPRRNPHLQG